MGCCKILFTFRFCCISLFDKASINVASCEPHYNKSYKNCYTHQPYVGKNNIERVILKIVHVPPSVSKMWCSCSEEINFLYTYQNRICN